MRKKVRGEERKLLGLGEIQSREKAGFDDWRLSKGKERSRDEMQALGAALIASLLGKCCCTARAAACPQSPGAQFAMYREVRDLDKKGLRWWRSSIRPHRGPISGGGVVFCVSLLLCFLPNSDGLSHDDNPRFGGRPLGAPPVHARCGLRDVFAAVPLHTMSPCAAGSHLGWEEERR